MVLIAGDHGKRPFVILGWLWLFHTVLNPISPDFLAKTDKFHNALLCGCMGIFLYEKFQSINNEGCIIFTSVSILTHYFNNHHTPL